jgi:hypothetical protein
MTAPARILLSIMSYNIVDLSDESTFQPISIKIKIKLLAGTDEKLEKDIAMKCSSSPAFFCLAVII